MAREMKRVIDPSTSGKNGKLLKLFFKFKQWKMLHEESSKVVSLVLELI